MDEKIQDIQPNAPRSVFRSYGLDNRVGHELRDYLDFVRYGGGFHFGRSADTGDGLVRVDLQSVRGK